MTDDLLRTEDETDVDRELGAGVTSEGGSAPARGPIQGADPADAPADEREDDPLAEVLDLGDDPIRDDADPNDPPAWRPGEEDSDPA
jgi:hypothetical protein